MIFLKNRLIFGIIKKILVSVFKVIYKVIDILNLYLTLFVLIIGAIIYLTGNMENNQTVKNVFILLIIISLGFAVILSVIKLFKIDEKIKKKKAERNAYNGVIAKPQEENTKDLETDTEEKTDSLENKKEYPIYYSVRQNPNYVYAEYEDKYVLYYKSKDGLKYIRTDFKS